MAPGFYAAYNTPRIVGAIDYSLIGRLWDDGDFDDFRTPLDANGPPAGMDSDLSFFMASFEKIP